MKQDVSDVEAFRIIHAKMAFIEQDITTSMYVYLCSVANFDNIASLTEIDEELQKIMILG